ncbi:hypothetical protein QBC35DRAFT_478879 [Podospora australis]|uniref:Uncharacterized protein n=1 Tax=Podospora australis TaxID=1536484 RepID=A0AAN7ADK5_9PEZI|nr:hypothetical protein QBC35DRAFT_478879 [Podospora australis]
MARESPAKPINKRANGRAAANRRSKAKPAILKDYRTTVQTPEARTTNCIAHDKPLRRGRLTGAKFVVSQEHVHPGGIGSKSFKILLDGPGGVQTRNPLWPVACVPQRRVLAVWISHTWCWCDRVLGFRQVSHVVSFFDQLEGTLYWSPEFELTTQLTYLTYTFVVRDKPLTMDWMSAFDKSADADTYLRGQVVECVDRSTRDEQPIGPPAEDNEDVYTTMYTRRHTAAGG